MRPRPVNDRYGHATGDLLIKAGGGRLRRVVRRTDTVARLGREEFTILEGLRHPDDAARVVEQALLSLRQPFELAGVMIEFGASLGVAIASHATKVPAAA